MAIFDEVLEKEYERSLRISAALEGEIAELPRGSVRERSINGRTYYYLQYRDGSAVRSDYVRREDVDALRVQLARRKEDLAALKEQREVRAKIERALGREWTLGRTGA